MFELGPNVKTTWITPLEPEYIVEGSWYTGDIFRDFLTLQEMGLSGWMYGEMENGGTLEDSSGNGYATSDLQDILQSE